MAILGYYGPKDPDETIPSGRWGIDWSPDLAEGETITSLTVFAIDQTNDDEDVTSTMITGGVGNIVDDIYTSQEIVGGINGHNYKIIHRVETSGGGVWEDAFIVGVASN